LCVVEYGKGCGHRTVLLLVILRQLLILLLLFIVILCQRVTYILLNSVILICFTPVGAYWSAALDVMPLEEDAGPLHVHVDEKVNALTNQIQFLCLKTNAFHENS